MKQEFPQALGELKKSPYHKTHVHGWSVKEEMRNNLLRMLRKKEELFPGIIGYEDTVIPQIVNAILSKHNMIFLGRRGQAKSRMLRLLVQFLDDWSPQVAGCEIHDSPYRPICRACRMRLEELGDSLPVSFLSRG